MFILGRDTLNLAVTWLDELAVVLAMCALLWLIFPVRVLSFVAVMLAGVAVSLWISGTDGLTLSASLTASCVLLLAVENYSMRYRLKRSEHVLEIATKRLSFLEAEQERQQSILARHHTAIHEDALLSQLDEGQ